MYRIRDGLTLIELLVVIGIIGVLIALLLPAVQSARESSRNSLCKNNLRQIGLAVLDYEAVHNMIPSLWNGTQYEEPRGVLDEFYFHSWQTPLLSALGESSLYDQIDLRLSPTHANNQENLNTWISVLICPSSPVLEEPVPHISIWPDSDDINTIPDEIAGTAARTDYEVIMAIGRVISSPRNGAYDQRGLEFGIWGEAQYNDDENKVLGYRDAHLKDVTDGLSKTILVTERSGRPHLYFKGRLKETWTFDDGMDNHQAAWGISTHSGWIWKHEAIGVNEYNTAGFFSFHPFGANVVMADGSVRFLTEEMDLESLNALITRAEGELAPK